MEEEIKLIKELQVSKLKHDILLTYCQVCNRKNKMCEFFSNFFFFTKKFFSQNNFFHSKPSTKKIPKRTFFFFFQIL